MTTIKLINLSGNKLSGTIPPGLFCVLPLLTAWPSGTEPLTPAQHWIYDWIHAVFGRLGALTELWLNDNQLTGSIPTNMVRTRFHYP